MMARGMEGQVAVVTGGARGIGAGNRTASGAGRLPDCAVGSEFMRPSTSGAAGFTPTAMCHVDVADYASVEVGLAATMKAVERIDILINDAGINGMVKPVSEYPLG